VTTPYMSRRRLLYCSRRLALIGSNPDHPRRVDQRRCLVEQLQSYLVRQGAADRLTRTSLPESSGAAVDARLVLGDIEAPLESVREGQNSLARASRQAADRCGPVSKARKVSHPSAKIHRRSGSLGVVEFGPLLHRDFASSGSTNPVSSRGHTVSRPPPQSGRSDPTFW
jgi:hypothetical protein